MEHPSILPLPRPSTGGVAACAYHARVSVRARSDQFKRLVRAALHDLFDQRHPIGRLALTQVLMTAGDTLFAVSLAGSLFFSISPQAAQDKILLYLLLTMAPFAVVAPALGPVIDRSRGARRAMAVTSAVGRALLCPFLARDIHSLLLFPEAFAMLVLSKVYLVTKGALVPEMAAQGLLRSPSSPASDVTGEPPPPVDLASLNARLGLLSSLAGFTAAGPAVATLKLGGAPAVLWLDAVVFVAAAVSATRLPVRARRMMARARPVPGTPGPRPVPGGPVAGGAAGPGLQAAAPVAPDDDWAEEQADLDVFRPVAGGEVMVALMPMSVLKAIGGFLTFLFAFGLRRAHAPTWWFGLLLGSVTLGAVTGVLLVAQIRRFLSEQQILLAALGLVAVVSSLGAAFPSRWIQALVAFGVGVAGAVAKPSFDALVQQFVQESSQGRAFARFETQFQLVWVLGSFVPVVLTLAIQVGNVVMAITAAVGALFYASSRRALRDHVQT